MIKVPNFGRSRLRGCGGWRFLYKTENRRWLVAHPPFRTTQTRFSWTKFATCAKWMNEPCLPGGSSAWPAWRQRREWRCGKGCYCGSPPPPDLQAKNGSNEWTCVKMAESLTHWRTSRLWPDPDGSGLSVRTRETNESTASEVDVLNEWNVHWFPLFNEWMTSANHLRSTCPRRKRWTAIGWSVPVASVVSMAKWMKWMAANCLQLIYFGGSVVEVVQKGILRLKSPGGRFLFPPLVQRLEPAAAVQSTRCSHWWLNTQKQQVYHRPTRSNLTQSSKSIVRLACQGPSTSKFAKKLTDDRKNLKKFIKFTHYLILKSAKFQNSTSKIVGTTRSNLDPSLIGPGLQLQNSLKKSLMVGKIWKKFIKFTHY